MKHSHAAVEGFVPQGTLLASAILAFLSIVGFLIAPVITEPLADMQIQPRHGTVLVGDTFTVSVLVTSKIPVNVFKGDIGFDPTKLKVEAIEYNTSIANLWARKPWYENGDGTLGFIGGTTQRGGFLGDGTLINVTFRSLGEGDASIYFKEARILEHDGLGTDVPLTEPIDSIFSVADSIIDSHTVARPESTTATIAVVGERPSTDIDGDGKQTLADVSIFILNLNQDKGRFDFNLDGVVNAKDLSIIMSAE